MFKKLPLSILISITTLGLCFGANALVPAGSVEQEQTTIYLEEPEEDSSFDYYEASPIHRFINYDIYDIELDVTGNELQDGEVTLNKTI
ncbi:MAG: hypothetical protein WC838_02425 [Candidatus Margulisiibacteriota bacterium]|jgi:hypothetical protein